MADTRVAVLFGGPSAEHEVSIRSAQTVVESLAALHEVWPVLLQQDGAAQVLPCIPAGGPGTPLEESAARRRQVPRMADLAPWLVDQVDVVFPCVHGRWGEDGVLQGWLECLGLPMVGSGVAASALCMDKQRTKEVLAARTSLALQPSLVHERHRIQSTPAEEFQRALRIPLPWFVKPSKAGSSVGLSKVTHQDGWRAAVDLALAVAETDGAMLETVIEGDEVTCLVIGNPETGLRSFPPVLIRPVISDVFDYKAKYLPGGSEELCPAPLDAEVLQQVERDSVLACHALGIRGVARLDFIVDRDHQPRFLEANTMPGFTRESLAPRAAQVAGLTLPRFFQELVELALVGHASRALTRTAP